MSDPRGCLDNKRFRLRDVVDSGTIQSLKIKSTNDVIELIKSKSVEKMCILAHPDRWNDSFDSWLYVFVTKKIRNICKIGFMCIRKRHFYD